VPGFSSRGNAARQLFWRAFYDAKTAKCALILSHRFLLSYASPIDKGPSDMIATTYGLDG